MNKHLLLLGLLAGMGIGSASGQMSFTNANSRLGVANHYSGCTVAVTDWNGDGLDDIVRLNQGHIASVEVQRVGNQFQTINLGDFGGNNGWSWGMAVGDFDNNGYKDIVAGGYGPAVKVLMTNNNGTGGNIVSIPNSGYFVQNITVTDFNNDGWLDLFVCDDNAPAHGYVNDGTGNLVASNIINFTLNPTVTYNGDPADSGNYGSAWIDFDNDGDLDLYVAHCRQSTTNPADLRRINRLFVNNGNGTYTEDAAAYNLNQGWQTWTASFGDIDNDADFDVLLTNHDHVSMIMQNDGSGHYTEITATTGFNISDITPIESVMEDFDNDGFIDILVTGSSSRLWRNNGNSTFSLVNGAFNTGNMLSFATGDLNHDGFVDLYASYGNIYTTPSSTVSDVFWLANRNENHFINLNLQGTASNRDAIGAKARIYGPWGVQVREVRSGESYGTSNSQMLHFGIGTATDIDSVVIDWPSHNHQTIVNPSIDQFLNVIEQNCVSPESIITSSGPMLLCTGQTLQLNAPAGYTYLWSTGATTQSISVSAAGEYNVRITAPGNACSGVSRTLNLVVAPDQTPTIAVTGETEFCTGQSVALSGPSANILGYSWSNGATTQTINAAQSGTYTLTIQGVCQQFTSLPVSVTVYEPSAPVAPDVVIPAAGTATLVSNLANTNWYDAPNAGTLLGTNDTLMLNVTASPTTVYAEAYQEFGMATFLGGKTNFTGNSLYSGSGTTNVSTTFNVLHPCVLKTVKVYTDKYGTRDIELKDNNGNVVAHTLANVTTDTAVVELNWALVPGMNYTIGTNATVNAQIPNWNLAGPRFRRNNTGTGVVYPYNISDLVSITGNSQGPSLYYYFYDWKVEKTPTTCITDRVPVVVTIDANVGLSDIDAEVPVLSPNPTADAFSIRMQQAGFQYEVFDALGQRVVLGSSVSNQANLNIGAFAAGIYTVRTIQQGKVYNQKLMKP